MKKKVKVYYSETYKLFFIESLNYFSSNLCLLNPSFRYVKKYKRLESRGTIIPFSYVNNDIRSICSTYSPVTLEIIGGEIMYSNEYSIMTCKKGKLALLNGGRVHVYGPE